MSSRLVALRRVSQFTFLAAFLAACAWAVYGRGKGVPVETFLRADPLLALSTIVSLRQFALTTLLWALPVVVLSLLMGRVFCGWICPMGTALDVSERVLRIRGRRPAKAPAWRQVKYYVLLALLVTMLLPVGQRRSGEQGLSSSTGLAATYLVDPIALLTRTVTWTGVPVVQGATNSLNQTLQAYSYSDFAGRHPALETAFTWGADKTAPVSRAVHFRLGLVSFVLFAGLVALGLVANRFWCRNLCPLGALLGWLGKRAPVRLHISEACNRCLRCTQICKTAAFTEDPHKYRGAECISCYSCLAVCPQHAISVTTGYAPVEREDEVRLDRRRILGAAGLGLAAAVLPKVDWSTSLSNGSAKALKVSSDRLIRPPGARPEDPFVSACVRCGECMAVCPTNALQPALGEGGIEAIGTPIVVPRIGPCTQGCTACGSVCPVAAIESFTVEEKSHLYLGTARVNRGECLAWSEGRTCMVCQEACSYQAIGAKEQGGVHCPVVNREICVGCGQCENVCPVEPRGAIRVSGGGDQRYKTRAEQRARREAAPAVGE